MQKQKTLHWCWAAVAVSVDGFYDANSRRKQCGIVHEVLRKTDREDAPPKPIRACCAKPVPRRCNVDWYLEDALEEAGWLKGNPKSGHLSFARIKMKIDAGRPVCLRIGWHGGGGHFIVISGYHEDRAGQKLLDVEDPLYGPSTITHKTLVSRYHDAGRWTHIYPV